MDPGNWATDLAGGARYGYTLLSVIMVSNLMAILLQALALRLGIASGRDLAQACRDSYSRPTTIALWILCEIAIAACDLAEVIGAAIALNLLFGLPLVWGVSITAFDVLLVLYLQHHGFRYVEALVIGLIVAIAGCFATELWLSRPDLAGDPDLRAADANYAEFSDLRAKILVLSRANTNVRSRSTRSGARRSGSTATSARDRTPPAEMPIPDRLNLLLVVFVLGGAIALLWLGSYVESWWATLLLGIVFSYHALLSCESVDSTSTSPSPSTSAASTTMGVRLLAASVMPVIALVSPGPWCTETMPGRPASLAQPSAMQAAPHSCRSKATALPANWEASGKRCISTTSSDATSSRSRTSE
jgi:hypothetical protein